MKFIFLSPWEIILIVKLVRQDIRQQNW